jgi:hypothetical protein
MTIRRRGEWLSAMLGGEMVMMRDGKYIGLSEVGVRIWDLLETPQDIGSLCAQLQREFAVDEATCRAEVENFLGQLAEHGAVEFSK